MKKSIRNNSTDTGLNVAAALLAVITAVLAAGCDSSTPDAAPPPPPQVTVVTMHPRQVAVTRDFTGRLSAHRRANVLARVPGVLLKRLYQEGTTVEAGQPLFEIDPAPYRAALDAALAALAQARANADNAHITARRDRKLIQSHFVSQSQLDKDEAEERSTAAAVKLAEANVKSARINLGYTNVTSPITGIAGEQQVTEGALVGQGSPTLLTTVEQIDPIYVNFDEPATQHEQDAARKQAGIISPIDSGGAEVQLMMADGSRYGRPGQLDFRAVTVDSRTGAITLRGIIPNPDHLLLPGMFVNVRLTVGIIKHAFLLPQAALQRDDTGAAYVSIVADGDKVAVKNIESEGMHGGDWIVPGGLADGDRVIVAGIQNARPGARVKAVETPAPNPAPGGVPGGAGVQR